MIPRIAVVVPAYNAAQTIGRTLQAIRAQSLSDWETIVVDDGSVDRTVEAVADIRDDRIHIVISGHAGVSAARNRGIAASAAPIVTFVDADDIPEPTWLEQLLEPFESERVGIVCCRVTRVLDDGTETAVAWYRDPVFGRVLFLPGSFGARRALMSVGFDERLSFGENSEIGHRLLLEARHRGYSVASVDAPLVRWHVDRRRGDARDAARLRTTELMLREHRETMSPRMVVVHERIAAVNAARIGHLRRARQHAMAAARSEPLERASWLTLAGAWLTPLGDRWSRPSVVHADCFDHQPLLEHDATAGERPDLVAPRVSVLMPVYNGESTVRAAVDSVLAQTFVDFELVIVDDGSTDGTAGHLNSYRSDPRVRVVTSPSNEGLVVALTRGLSQCRGGLVARLDADDVARPTRLERQAAVFDADSRVVLCATAYDRVSEDGQLLKHSSPPSSHAEMAAAMLSSNRIHHSSVMFRRAAVARVGGYDPGWFPVEDYDLWLRLLEVGRYVGLVSAESVYVQRSHGISATMSVTQSRRAAERAAQYRCELTGRASDTGRIGTTVEVARASLSIRRRVRRRGFSTRGLERQALRTINRHLRAEGRLVRSMLVLVLAPRIAVRGRMDRSRHDEPPAR